MFLFLFIFMFILQDSFCYWVTFACKKQVEKEAGAFEQTFPAFRFGIGWHYILLDVLLLVSLSINLLLMTSLILLYCTLSLHFITVY